MNRYRWFASLLILILTATCAPAHAQGPKPDEQPLSMERTFSAADWALIPLQTRLKVDPRVIKQFLEGAASNPNNRLDQTEMITFLVYLETTIPEKDLDKIPSSNKRRQALVQELQDAALSDQSGIRTYLESRLRQSKIARYESFWIFNGLVVQGDFETVVQLAQRPEVEAIRPNRIHRLVQPSPTAGSAGLPWGLAKIGADRVWQTLGITGQGVVVANLDSGVDWTHPALQSRYRGYNAADPTASDHNYNWFDPTGTYPREPGPRGIQYGSAAKHGTHTMGTLVGLEAGAPPIGVAPGAQWIALKIFDDAGEATDEWIHKGFQWCLAPTDLDGLNPDPDRAPDIVSNSWGDDDGTDQTFAQDLRALRQAGIMTTFSAGNNGPLAGTVGSPGSLSDAFAVGASDSSDLIARFSGRGPSPWDEIKPDVVAPGVDILSSVPGGTYESSWDGTSMAAPHVAGLAALVLQARRQAASSPGVDEALPSMTITATEYLIASTAVDLGTFGPDADYGYGRIDAYQAIASIIDSGAFSGRVTDARSGDPIPDALITMRNAVTQGQMTTRTNADGTYALSVAEGIYDVTASQFGYQDHTVNSIQVLAQTATQLDFALARLPSGTIKGRVTLDSTGQPAPTHIQVLGTPLNTTADAQGYYTVVAPVGTYTMRAMPAQPGYRGSRVEGIQVRADKIIQVDLRLSLAPRILLVDADAWVPESHIAYYSMALDNLLYGYDTWVIDDAKGHKPTAADLALYDLVIWSQPHASPGYIEAWEALSEYLEQGGKLFISGEDIGYFDRARDEYLNYLNATYLGDNSALETIIGIEGDILAGIQLDYNTPDSAGNQTSPDMVALGNARGRALQNTRRGHLLSLRGDSCVFRTIYLSYGLEGVGPASQREQVLEKAILWTQQARPTRAASLTAPILEANATVDRNAGAKVSYDLNITNDGASPTIFDIATHSAWPSRVIDSLTGEPIARTRALDACESQALRLEVSVPRSAYAGELLVTTVEAKAVGSASIGAMLAFRTRAMNTWSWGPSLTTPRYRASVVAIGCAIYCVGGLTDDSDNALSTLEILDPGANAWRPGAHKPTAATNSAAVTLDGRMVVLGGYDPSREMPYLDTVETYDPASNAWTAGVPLPRALSGIAAAVYSNKIYVFGGNSSDGDSVQNYVYDPAAGRWSAIASLPSSQAAFSQAATLGGYIYLAGGWPDLNQLLRYDPVSDSWAALTPMNAGRHSFALVADESGHLYAAGGGDEWDGLASAEQYDPASDAWSVLPSLRNSERAGTAGVYVDGEFYVMGGTEDSTTNQVEMLELDTPLSGSHLAVDAPYCRWGDVLSFRLTLRNPTGSAKRANWTHILPTELAYVEGSASAGIRFVPQSRMLLWEGDIAASSLLDLDFRARVNSGLVNDTVISSIVQLETGTCSPQVLSASTQLSMPLLHPRLTTKTVDKATAAPGDRLHYTIRMANASPFDITIASLVDPIPEGTTLVAGSVQGASYDAAEQRIEWTGALPPRPETSPTFFWVDASNGQSITLGDDECAGPLDLGFVFEFYGHPYSQVHINSNGMLLFGQCATAYSNTEIPSSSEPNNLIAPLWDDLTAVNGRVYLATFGSAPQRYAAITWHDVSFYGLSEQKQTFQVILYEGTNRITFQYLALNGERSAGGSATVGIENIDGSAGVQYLYDGSPAEHALAPGTVIEMIHSSSSDRASFHLASYDLVVNNPLPPGTFIRNTAQMEDGLLTYQRTVTTSIDSPCFADSYLEVVPQRARSGEQLDYRLQIANSGSQPAIAVAVSNPIPIGTAYEEGSLSGSGARYNASTRSIEWQGQLTPQASIAISYRARLASDLAPNTWITNTAVISEQGVRMEQLDAGTLVNEVNLGTSHKQVNKSEAIAGTALTYSITVSNSGMVTAPNVRLTDTLPLVLNIEAESLRGAIYDPSTRGVYWRGPLAPEGQHIVTFAANSIPSAASGARITNTALIDNGYGLIIGRSAGLVIFRGDLASSDMDVSPTMGMPGETVTYTVRMRNTGGADTDGSLTCALPAPLALIASNVYASSGKVRVVGNKVTWEGTIVNEGMVIVRYGVRIPSNTPSQTLLTEATLVDSANLVQRFGATLYIGKYLLIMPILRR